MQKKVLGDSFNGVQVEKKKQTFSTHLIIEFKNETDTGSLKACLYIHREFC
jgi:hypothetical protein